MITQQSFSDLVGDIYSSASDFSNWQRVLRRVADVFGGNCSVLGVTDEKQNFSAYVAPLTDPAFVTSYNTHYHAISPLMPRIRALPAGSVVTDRMELPRREFVRSDIDTEWILPQGIKNKLYTVVLSEPNRRVILGVHSEREFDDEQIRFCQLLTPHLQRAMQLSLGFLRVNMLNARATVRRVATTKPWDRDEIHRLRRECTARWTAAPRKCRASYERLTRRDGAAPRL